MGYQDDRALQKTLGGMLQRAQNAQEPLREIGFLMVQEMKTNIEQGGRPKRWPRSIRVQASRTRVMQKHRKGKYTREEAVNRGGTTLRDSGTMVNSMTSEVQGNTVAAGPTAVGRKKLSDPRILAYLAYGGTVRAKNKPFLRFPIPGGGWARVKEVTNPARDFTYMPPEAHETFGEVMQRYVVGN